MRKNLSTNLAETMHGLVCKAIIRIHHLFTRVGKSPDSADAVYCMLDKTCAGSCRSNLNAFFLNCRVAFRSKKLVGWLQLIFCEVPEQEQCQAGQAAL